MIRLAVSVEGQTEEEFVKRKGPHGAPLYVVDRIRPNAPALRLADAAWAERASERTSKAGAPAPASAPIRPACARMSMRAVCGTVRPTKSRHQLGAVRPLDVTEHPRAEYSQRCAELLAHELSGERARLPKARLASRRVCVADTHSGRA